MTHERYDWSFEVRPGTLYYPGSLEIERWYGVRSFDRSAEMLERLERDHPDLLKRFPIIYSGPGRDDFLEFYERTRATLASGGEPERP